MEYARRRCGDRDSRWWPWYGSRGIKCFLTAHDARLLWERDGADQLRRPSLDRIDSNGHYEVKNCRFVELVQNVMRGGGHVHQ